MKVFILGGYGSVGSNIASFLIEEPNIKVTIAGRRYEPAKKLAEELGNQATFCVIDVTTSRDYDAILEDIDVVIVCIDLPDDRFVRTCLQRGISYVDISAESTILSRIEALDNLAKEHNASAIISVGLMPGLSNLMAKRGVKYVEDAERVDNVILLGLGEAFGVASADWSLQHIGDQYLRNRIRIDMGENIGKRAAYRFAFADQYIIPKTLAVSHASSWGCYDSVTSTHLIGVVRLLRLGWLFKNPLLRRIFISIIQKLRIGSDQFILTSCITSKQPTQQYQSWLVGKGEAVITASVVANTIKMLWTTTLPIGVYHLEQIFELNDFLPILFSLGVIFNEQQY